MVWARASGSGLTGEVRGRVVLAAVVLCGAERIGSWLAVIWKRVVTFSSPSAVWGTVVCTPGVCDVFYAMGGRMCCRWSSAW